MIYLKEIVLDEVENVASSKLLFTDLSRYLSGDLELEKPDVAEMWDSEHHLFYAGRLNEIHSEPGIGKTNVLIAAVIAEIRKNRKIVYIDPEDTPRGFVIRLRSLGATTEQISGLVNYLHNPEPPQIKAAQVWAMENQPSLVILDGMAESMASQGKDEDRAQDVLPFLQENVRPFAESGAAVVIADHVTKSKESRGRFARGSGAKLGRYDGVVYEIASGQAYRPGEVGYVKLKVQKDRNGGVGSIGETYAELHFLLGTDGGTIIEFREPVEKSDGSLRPTAIMEKILKHLEQNGKVNATELRKIGGKTEHNNLARDLLLQEGQLEKRRDGNSTFYYLKSKTQPVLELQPSE